MWGAMQLVNQRTEHWQRRDQIIQRGLRRRGEYLSGEGLQGRPAEEDKAAIPHQIGDKQEESVVERGYPDKNGGDTNAVRTHMSSCASWSTRSIAGGLGART